MLLKGRITMEEKKNTTVVKINGAEYRMTYPFNHEDYPLWYPLPKD